MHLVELLEQPDPVVGARDLAREPAQLRGEEVVLLASALAERARVVGEQLLLLEQRGVQLLADGVVAGGLVLLLDEESGERLERVARLGADGRELLPRRGVLHLERHELARVLRRGAGLADGAVDVDPRNDREVEVVHALAQRAGDLGQPGARGVGQILLGAQLVEEEREDALQSRVQVGRGLALPIPPRRRQLAPAQDRAREVAVDPLGRRERVIGERAESREPGGGPLLVPAERVGREVVELLVVGGEAKAAGLHRRLGELLLQERIGEVGERRHGPLP